MVIDAFLKVQQNHPEAELEIAGAVNPGDVYTTAYYPRLRDRLFKLAKREITLRLNPSDDEIVNVYKSSRIFANYNPGEHFGICVVESQAAGTVPIVASGGGQIETVANGETGFLVNNCEEMVEKMELLLEDDLTFKRMSEKAMEKAKLFSNESFAAKWVNLIEEITV
jgi:alpha-1,2-mannosyltransferase